MKFENLLNKAADLSCFSTGFLAAGGNLSQIRLQLSRWVKDGRLVKLHKGLYSLAQAYRKVKAELFCIANNLKRPSYVSLQSALSWYGLIPEFVPAVTSVTGGRPQTIETPLGVFYFRHIDKSFLYGYSEVELSNRQTAFVARPEKALLDLIYLTAGGDKEKFLEELRLQNLEIIDKTALRQFVEKAKSPKLNRALKIIERLIDKSKGDEQ